MASKTVFQCDCLQLTVDEDESLPSPSVFQFTGDEGPCLLWPLNYLHDRLVKKGESRTFWKWCQFFQQSVATTALKDLSGAFFHFRGNNMPPGALDESVASTEAVLSFFASVLDVGRKIDIVKEVESLLLTRIRSRVCEEAADQNLLNIAIGQYGAVSLQTATGLVSGLQGIVRNKHKTAFESWMGMWNAMKEAGSITSELAEDDLPLPFSDVMVFAFQAARSRRSMAKAPWSSNSPSMLILLDLQRGIIELLSNGLYDYITGRYQDVHDVSKAAPARRHSKDGSFSMPVENIWDVLDHSQTTGKNVRQSLEFCKSRLSKAGGVHENAADSWVRRRQIIYDQRLVSSLVGASHFNLVSDASKHSGMEVLVSVIFSHENQTAGLPPLQVILPCDALLAPGELDLTSLVEQLAKDNKLQRLAAYRQLQAISHQLQLSTGGRFNLTSFGVPEYLRLSPVEPGQTRFCHRVTDAQGSSMRLAGIEFESAAEADPDQMELTDRQEQFLLPSEAENPNWWLNVPILTLQLDQGGTGMAGAAYAIHHLGHLIHVRWDIFHRCIRDLKLSLQYSCRGIFLQAQMHSNYMWGLSYRPYGTGHFHEHKKRLMEILLSRESWETCNEFDQYWEDIRDDLGMSPHSSMEEVWRELPSCRLFQAKGTCPKQGRWFAWNDAATEQLPEFHVLKMVLKYHHGSEDGKKKLDPDEHIEQEAIALATRRSMRGDGSRADMRQEFSDLKKALGGGTRLAYFCMSERLWALCHILQVVSEPCWTWYAHEVKENQNHIDCLNRTIHLQTHWAGENHLQRLAAIPTSRHPIFVRLIAEKRVLDTGPKTVDLCLHILTRRAWSFVRHNAPPDCYAGILDDSNPPLQQDGLMMT